MSCDFCPYCGGVRLKAKKWAKFGTWFIACEDCKATGPSLATSETEAWELFRHRVDVPNQSSLSL